MSKEVDRTQVLQNIRVRKLVKNDSCWIKPRDNQAKNKEISNPAAEKKRAYVQSATKKFEDPTKQTNDEVNPAPKNAPTKEPKVDTVGDTKLQSPTEQLIENGKTQADKAFKKNKKIEASAPIDKPNVDNKKKVEEFSADNKEQTQPATAVKQNLDAAAPAETTPAKETPAEDKEEHAAAPPDQSNIDNEFKASSDAKVENCVPEASARGATSGSSGAAKVLAAPRVQLKPPEIVVTQTEPASPTIVETEKEEVPIQTVNGGEQKSLPTEAKDDAVVLAVKIMVESVPETAVDTGADSDLQVEPLSDSPAQPAEKPPSGDKSPASQDMQPVSDTLSESPPADAVVKSAERELDSASPPHAEPVSGTRTQEVVKSAPEQSVEPKQQDVVDHLAALPVKEVVVPAPDAKAVQDNSAFKAIDLTEALDVEPQSNKSAPKPEDSQQTVPEKQKQQDDNTKTSETRFQKPEEKLSSTQTQNRYRYGKSGCSFCNGIIDGNIRLILNEPPVTLHPECLQCGVCAKALGDLLTLIYLHDKVIHCNDCFQKAVNV